MKSVRNKRRATSVAAICATSAALIIAIPTAAAADSVTPYTSINGQSTITVNEGYVNLAVTGVRPPQNTVGQQICWLAADPDSGTLYSQFTLDGGGNGGTSVGPLPSGTTGIGLGCQSGWLTDPIVHFVTVDGAGPADENNAPDPLPSTPTLPQSPEIIESEEQTCSESIAEEFGGAGYGTRIGLTVAEELLGTGPIESAFQGICGALALNRNPVESIRAACRGFQSLFPVDLGLQGADWLFRQVDNLIGADDSAARNRQATMQAWSNMCSSF